MRLTFDLSDTSLTHVDDRYCRTAWKASWLQRVDEQQARQLTEWARAAQHKTRDCQRTSVTESATSSIVQTYMASVGRRSSSSLSYGRAAEFAMRPVTLWEHPMGSSISVFVLRQPVRERLPTTFMCIVRMCFCDWCCSGVSTSVKLFRNLNARGFPL